MRRFGSLRNLCRELPLGSSFFGFEQRMAKRAYSVLSRTVCVIDSNIHQQANSVIRGHIMNVSFSMNLIDMHLHVKTREYAQQLLQSLTLFLDRRCLLTRSYRAIARAKTSRDSSPPKRILHATEWCPRSVQESSFSPHPLSTFGGDQPFVDKSVMERKCHASVGETRMLMFVFRLPESPPLFKL